MPALAPAPLPSSVPGSSAELDPPSGLFTGRSLAEYAECFALDLAALKGRDVLDVAAGPSSFTAEACARRIDAVAVDPLFGEPIAALAARVERDDARMQAQLRVQPRRCTVSGGSVLQRLNQETPAGSRCHVPSLDAAEADRRTAVQRFLDDYETHFAYGRYVGGLLPHLPFFDRTFDLVLCAHFLFDPAGRPDGDWQLAACRELMRVSAGEVRIEPLGGAAGRPYPGLPRVRRELRADGIASQIVGVADGFLAGVSSMLVLRRAAS